MEKVERRGKDRGEDRDKRERRLKRTERSGETEKWRKICEGE